MYKNQEKLLIQAHRGYSGKYPENTLISFEKAIEAGADMVEFDLHLSKDEKLFVIHDSSVDRTTDGNGDLKDLSYKEIKKLDAGSWFDDKYYGIEIPTFSETLSTLKNKAIASIEIKTEFSGYKIWRKMINKIIKTIDDWQMWDEVMFISFDFQPLLAIMQRRPQAFTGFIDYRKGEEVKKMNMLKAGGIDGWFAPFNIVTKRLVQKAHKLGLKVISGGGKDLATIEDEVIKLINVGVDGISTDYPSKVKQIIDKNKLS